jgi:CBS domain-containing protein
VTPDQAIAFMKEHKILSLKLKDLELVLHPDALFEPTKPAEIEPELDDKEIGLSGVTRRRQKELLGVVIESDFVKAK